MESYYTTGEAAERLSVPRATVCHAIDRARIKPAARAGIVRLFSAEQWPEIVRAVRAVERRGVAHG